MGRIIGIDLGTSFSATAQVRDGQPELILGNKERLMPSVVGLTPQGKLVIGTPARNQYELYPEQTIRSIKRLMGSEQRIRLGQRYLLPQEVSALLLRELKRRVEAQVKETVDRAVITVPAYFSDAARQATREAGEIAGFRVERIINEPTAAALAYGLGIADDSHQYIAVYDLGGGTFDVSIIELDGGVVEVRASHGNTRLGGDDFDALLIEHCAHHFEAETGIDLRGDRRAMARLSRAAETAKIALSQQAFVRIHEAYIANADGVPLHLELEIGRSEFESLIENLLSQTVVSFRQALDDAGLEAHDLERILLVGGSTRIPRIQQLLYEEMGIQPEVVVDPDEAVALGAAVQAAIIAGEPLDAILVDVTPHSLGIEIAKWEYGSLVSDRYSVIIQRNTSIPTSRSEVYSAITPDQTAIEVKVYQGENPIASRNTLLGDFLFEDLVPEAPDTPPRITVQFDFDLNGILQISAQDRGSGKQAGIKVAANRARLNPKQISAARNDLLDFEAEQVWLESAEIAPKTPTPEAAQPAVPNYGASNLEAIALLARARRAVSFNQADTSALQTAIAALDRALLSGDPTLIAARSDDLLDQLYELDDE
jgi:molecular chaperone DnaK